MLRCHGLTVELNVIEFVLEKDCVLRKGANDTNPIRTFFYGSWRSRDLVFFKFAAHDITCINHMGRGNFKLLQS